MLKNVCYGGDGAPRIKNPVAGNFIPRLDMVIKVKLGKNCAMQNSWPYLSSHIGEIN